MIKDGNYKPIDIKELKKGLLATLGYMYGRANPRMADIVNSLDIMFYTDEDTLHEVVDTTFNKNKYKTIGKFIRKLPVDGNMEKKEYAMYSLLGNEEEGNLVLGDGCALNVAYNMLSVGPDVYIQDLESEKRKKYIHACKKVLDSLNLTDKPRVMQLLVLEKLNRMRLDYIESNILAQGQVGKDYLSLYYQTVSKSEEYIDYVKDSCFVSERDRKIIDECGIDENVLENLSMVGIYYGTSIQTPGDIVAFSKDADRKLQRGELTEVIYRKRVKVMEYINSLPARVPEKGETWENIYREYVRQGYKKLNPEDVADLEEYRKILASELVTSTSQIENIISLIENPMGADGYLVPTTISRNMFMQENSVFIPNAKKAKDGSIEKRGVVILDDNIHIGADLALKYFLHEAGHGVISEVDSISEDGVVTIKDAMFGLFNNDTKCGLDENGEVIEGYKEPINLIENINERKAVEMLMTYQYTLNQESPFKASSDVVYHYINSYRVGNFITEGFYEKFKGVINRDLGSGKYTLRDAVGKENIMALENLLEEFNSSSVRREIFNALLMGATDRDFIKFLPTKEREEYYSFQKKAGVIVNKMVKHNFRFNNPEGM